MATLYSIADELGAVLSESDDGELSADLEARISALEMALEEKADGVCRFIRQCQSDADAYSEEAARLTALAKSAANKADRLKRYLLVTLQGLGITKLSTPLFILTVARNSQPSVTLVEGSDVPQQYARVKVELDRSAVLEAYKSGQTLPEALTVETGCHLRLR